MELPKYLQKHGSRSLKSYLEMARSSPPLFFAPNLKTAALWKYSRRGARGCASNRVAYKLVRNHLAAFRWTNPQSMVYLREVRTEESQSARVEYELLDGRRGTFTIQAGQSPELVLAKLMFAARDPAFDPAGSAPSPSWSTWSPEPLAAPAAADAEAGTEEHSHGFADLLSDGEYDAEGPEDMADAGAAMPARYVDFPEDLQDARQKTPIWESHQAASARREAELAAGVAMAEGVDFQQMGVDQAAAAAAAAEAALHPSER